MIVTPLVKKGVVTIPASVGDIYNNCAGNVQLSGTAGLLTGAMIAAGDVLLEDPVAVSGITLFPKAIDLLNALRGNANPEVNHQSASYALPAIVKYQLDTEVNQVQPGMTFVRTFYGDSTLAEEEFIYLEANEGIFFDAQGLDVFVDDEEMAPNQAISFSANQWKEIQFKIVNSNEPTIIKGATGTAANSVQVDVSLVRYLSPGMSLYTDSGAVFDSEAGEVKVIAIDYDRGLLFMSEDRVAPSTSFNMKLTPTILVTPIREGGGAVLTGIAWGEITGDITDQTDLNTLLDALDAADDALDTRVDALEAGAIGTGVAFPGSPVDNQLFYRTDRDILYFYNGTRWLSVQQFVIPLTRWSAFPGTAISATTAIVCRADCVFTPTYDFWVETLSASCIVATTNSGTAYWNIVLTTETNAGASTTLGTGTTQSLSPDIYLKIRHAINALIGTTAVFFQIGLTKVTTPGNITFHSAHVVGRLVG